MDFNQRLQRASDRGDQIKQARTQEATAKALSEEECRRLHTSYRLTISEHVETCLQQLTDNIPGFNFRIVANDKGWGATVSRDDLSLAGGQRSSLFSQYTVLVSPYGKYHVLDLVAKGTICNKESYHRNHYQLLKEADLDSFRELVELWTLDYAEQYAANR
jgi:hypothetical protein